jgi:hypothetical protein
MGLGLEINNQIVNCTICNIGFNPSSQFKKEIEKREYKISGMCKKCQDEIFRGVFEND